MESGMPHAKAMHPGDVTESAAIRFMCFIEEDRGHWFWIGAKTAKGYGIFLLNGKPQQAHRVGYVLRTNKSIQPEEIVLHDCEYKLCIFHTHTGSVQENADDSVANGTAKGPVGIANAAAKVDEAKVREIRALAATGLTNVAIARQYGLGKWQVGQIVRRLSWSHVQ